MGSSPARTDRPPDGYWEGVAQEWAATRPQRLWRQYCDRLNARFFEHWLPRARVSRALKTDLFDEATGETGLLPLLTGAAETVIGIDVADLTLRRASGKQTALRVVRADVRELPFADQSFDLILSNSTLDHFRSLDELAGAMSEIRRVLRSGGRLLLTLDNLDNPVLALRSAVPYSWLHRLGLVPYYVGATCGSARLRRIVQAAGLTVETLEMLMHCPRAPAVLAAGALDRLGNVRAKAAFLRGLMGFERLAAWPTRRYSGYFIGLRATRRDLLR